MQSNQDNSQSSNQPTATQAAPQPQAPQNPSSPNISRSPVLKNLSHILPEESPLAFINRNLRSVTESPETINQGVNTLLEQKTPPSEVPTTPTQKTPEPSEPVSDVDDTSSSDPLDVLDLEENTPPTDTEEPEKPKLTLQDNFKQLRKNHRETINQLKAVEEEKIALQKKVEDLNTGNATPEVIQKYEDKIQELSYFQKLHDFKASDEYEELHRPIATATSRLTELAKEYEIPENVINEALNISSKRELNEFLSDNFDIVGATEAKNLIDAIHTGRAQIQEAEKRPAEALAELREQQQVARAHRDIERKNKIKSRSEAAWRQALSAIRSENRVKELIPSSENSEHNEKIVKPLLTAAGAEFGKMVRSLADAGITELSPELALAMANAVLYGHASAVSVNQREEAVNYATELHETMTRDARFNRPTIGSSGKPSSAASTSSNSEPMTPSKAAKTITQGILSRRG